MRKLAALLAALLMLAVLPRAAAAAGREQEHINYITDIFNEENGLPTGEANAVVQAPDGYLWIGSYGGLLRYDGSQFVDFSDNLASSAIRALFVSSDGALYIGTNDAGAYRFRDDVFTPILCTGGNAYLCIRDFAEGEDGTVYAASTSGMAKVEGDRLEPILLPELQQSHFLKAAVDSCGNVWTLSDAGMAFVFREGSFLFTVPAENVFSGESIYTLCAAGGGVCLGSSGSTVMTLRLKQGARGEYLEDYERREYDTGELRTINHLKSVRDGTILVSALNGFGFLDAEGIIHRVDREMDNGLSANWAELDREGNRWVASSYYGVVRYSTGCFDSCNYNSDLGEYTVSAVTKQGGVFYVALDGGVRLFDEDWRPVESSLTELLKGIRVRNVTVDAAGRVWMATYSGHGALCYDPKTGETTDYGLAQGLNSEIIRVVYPLSDGGVLVGNQLGVNIIRDGVVAESYGSEDGMETTSVLCAMELDGRLYVGTDGSGIYEISDGGLRNLGFDQGLSQGVVLRMEPDADGNGNYYVCAGDKLYYGENDSFRELGGFDHGSGSIYSVYDVNGRLWLLQNGGVYSAEKAGVLAGEDVYTAHYGVQCGLTGTLNANTWNWIDEEGSLYMPTRRGISVFHFRGPEAVMPTAILNSVDVDGKITEHPQSVHLPRDARRLTVDISELLFSESAEYVIGYKLAGFDTAESFTTEKHVTVSYTNLRGGSYALELRIIDPLTGESAPIQSVLIEKEKSIVEQPWFYILCLLAVLLLAVVFVWIYLRHKTKLMEKKQEEQRRYIDEITKVFSDCVDMRDAYTNGHSARVARYAAMLAEKLGKSREEVEKLYHIALLHDVGKISIPDAVLNKPGRLTDEEYEIMKSHSQRGYDVLKHIDIDPTLAQGAGSHHERWDGLGYPNGLKGTEIPEASRIIAVADSFDAMYSTRPYRKKMELHTAVEEIRRCSGSQFAPEVVDAFLELAAEGAFTEE